MKKTTISVLTLLLCIGCLAACGKADAGTLQTTQKSEQSSQTEESTVLQNEPIQDEAEKRTAFDGAIIQTENPNKATRIIENGTKVNLLFGDDIVIPATLNDSEAAKALIEQLPYTIQANKGSHDFCGRIEELFPYTEKEEHYGWLNGDIDFTTSNWLAIFFNYEEESDYDAGHVNLGAVDCDLSQLEELSGSYEVTMELAE